MCKKVRRPLGVISSVSLVFAVVLAGAGQVGAVTPSYTPEYRGYPNSVHAIFDRFSTAWQMTVFESVSGGYPLDSTTPSASDDGIDTTIFLPNFIDPLSVKCMRIQMFFDGAVSSEAIDGDIIGYDPTGQTQVNYVGGSTGTANVHYVDFEIFPNPDWEEIVLFGNEGANVMPGNLLKVEIDTVSLPEPATLGLLVAGGLAMLVRKRVSRVVDW